MILDGSARRFQAHRIYLRIAAVRRWALNRRNVLRGQRPTAQNMAQLNSVGNAFQQVSHLHSQVIPAPGLYRSFWPMLTIIDLGIGPNN